MSGDFGDGSPNENPGALTPRLVQFLCKFGPNIPLIARDMGTSNRSVRLLYGKLVDKGFALQAIPNHEKLGLRRLVIALTFPNAYEEYAEPILIAMSEFCYLVGFYKTTPFGIYLVHVSVPIEHTNTFVDLLNSLKSKGLFSSLQVFLFDAFRKIPMRVNYYDFDAGRWDFDWSERKMKIGSTENMTSRRTEFDATDVAIIRELQRNASLSINEMSESLRLDVKTVKEHYKSHVVRRRLIKSYHFNWVAWPYDYGLKKASYRRHSYVGVAILAKNLQPRERTNLILKMNSLPFVLEEAYGDDYYVSLPIPMEEIEEALDYISKAIEPVKERASFYIIDQKHSLNFAISYRLYDAGEKSWTFNEEDLISKFDTILNQLGGRPRMQDPLVSRLASLKPGRAHWSKYQQLCKEILTFCLVPPLKEPLEEISSVGGHYRMDLAYPIPYGAGDLWEHVLRDFSSLYLVVDCKNYSTPLRQNQVVIVSKYFGQKKASGKFGIILCRKGLGDSAKKEQLQRWISHDEMIVCLSDHELREMMNLKRKGLDPGSVIDRKYRECRMEA